MNARRLWISIAAVPIVLVGAVAGVLTFNTPPELPRLAAGDGIPGIERWDHSEVPPRRTITARDGAPLTFRHYPARPDRAVVLVHGSSGSSYSMHKLAQALQTAGASVWAVDLRGHGGSGAVRGDVGHIGQLDEDLHDLLKATGLGDPKIHRTLMGFSSGGGFVLRVASGPDATLFDRYLALAPYVAHDSPTVRPKAGGWAGVAVGRMIVLSTLERFGLAWFQSLPVVRFATDGRGGEERTTAYSYRLLASMQIGQDWRQRLGRIEQKTIVLAGGRDELFDSAQFAPTLLPLSKQIAASIQPTHGHMDLIADPRATFLISMVWQQGTRE